MAKSASGKYQGSLSLEWFNKQKAILLLGDEDAKKEGDIPAPRINWINRDDALFYEIDEEEGKGLTPYWVDRNDIRAKEARPLVFKKAYIAKAKEKPGSLPGMDVQYEVKESKVDDPTIQNWLIKGDNLLALNTLKKYFDRQPDSDKVKCIYIDPPYRTGNAFQYYDDNMAHSEWLSLMRDRLEVLSSILSSAGFIFVQIDEGEQGYLRVLMDEIFGADCFVNQVTIKSKPSAGASGGGEDKKLKKNTEFILIYKRNVDYDFSFSHEKEYVDLFDQIDEMEDAGKSWKYTSILLDKGVQTDTLYTQDGSGATIEIRRFSGCERTTIANEIKRYSKFHPELSAKEIRQKVYLDHFNTVFSDTNAQSSIRQRVIDSVGSLEESEILEVEYVPRTGRDKGNPVIHYYISNSVRRVIWLRDSATRQRDKIDKAQTLGTLWAGINWNNVTKEGDVKFPSGKKPEALIEQIICLVTDPGDIVLDSFGGSGTTAAVAHKLGRRWITIEVGKQADDLIATRMKRVLAGENQAKIAADNWKGGGSFKYYHLGPSIINVDKKTGKGEFNWALGRTYLQESLLQSYDFKLDAAIKLDHDLVSDLPAIGRFESPKGVIFGVAWLAAPEEPAVSIDAETVQALYNTLKEHGPRSIHVFTNKGWDIKRDAMPPDMEIIKVPHAIFAELER
ncbi:site-specific DNA-methyltransferase [Acidithiobacillus sp.]